LKLNEFKLTEWLKNSLQVLLGDVEMDVADIKAVERDRIGVRSRSFRVSGLPVFLGFCDLYDDRNT
jgi:hypothetical protein